MHGKRILALFLSLGLAACQGVGGAQPRSDNGDLARALEVLQVTLGEEVDRVSNFQLNGWARIDDTHLMVTAGVHDHYLLTLLQPCFGLDYAFRIAIESRGFNLTRFDDVIVRGLHDGPERCRIDRIYKLEDIPGTNH